MILGVLPLALAFISMSALLCMKRFIFQALYKCLFSSVSAV